MDNVNDKREMIAALQNLFGEMTSSRTKLKPILTEIVKALDDNLFVDADSEEVHDLLEEIIDIQSQFADVDEIKGAVSSKSVDKIENALHNMEIKNSVAELKIVLNRFSELKCRSENEDERAAANRLIVAARKLLVTRGEKNGAEGFLDDGIKFEYITKIIRARRKPSSAEIAKVHEMFEDITLAYLLMDRSLIFASDEAEEGAPPEKLSPLESLKGLIEKAGVNVNNLLVDESEFAFERRETKKRMSTKNFQSTLKTFSAGKDAEFKNEVRRLLDKRIELINKLENEKTASRNLEPLIFDKLYQMQVADKFSWHGQSFYYINDYGFEMLTKILPDAKSGAKKTAKLGIAYWMRKFTVLKVLNIFRLDQKNFTLENDLTQFRFRVRPPESPTQVYYAMALMLFESNWSEELSITLLNLKNEAADGRNVRALLLCTTLAGEQLTPWFQLFEAANVKNVFAVRIDGKIIANDGEVYEVADLWNYINNSDCADFEAFKKKYIKRRKRRRRKTDDDDGEPKPPKSKAVGDRKKKTTPPKDEPPKDVADNGSTISLFSSPTEKPAIDDGGSDGQYHFDPTTFRSMTQQKSDEPIADEPIVDEPSVDEPIVDEPSVDETIAEEPIVEEPSVEEPAASFDDRFKLPIAVGANIEIDLEQILINATVMFLNGNAARGLMEMRLCEELQSEERDWARGLLELTAEALNDPMSGAERHELVPSELSFFDRATPLATLDAEFLRGFYVTMFVTAKSYAPNMYSIYELRNRQAALLSDKTNAALRMCPSIKKLIALFKNFTDKTNASFAESLHIDHAGVRARLKRAEAELQTMCERADSSLKSKMRHPRVNALVHRLFDPDAELRRMIEINGVTLEELADFCASFTPSGKFPSEDEAGDKIFAPKKIDAYLDGIWESIKVDSHKSENFMGDERMKQTNILKDSLKALREYVPARRQFEALGDDSSASKAEALSIIDEIRAEFESNARREFNPNWIAPAVMMIFINQLRSNIADRAATMFYRDCLLGAKYIELTPTNLPEQDDLGAPRYSFAHRLIDYERALDGLTAEEALQAAYETAVRTYDLGMLDRLEENYGDQLTHPSEERRRLRAVMSAQVDKRLDILHGGFMKKLALDRHYARLLNPEEADYYETAATTARHHFSETRNAGLFERFIDALKFGIAAGTESYVEELRARLNEVEPSSQPTVEKLIADGRLNVAEDCINGGVAVDRFETDGLEDFLSASEPIFNVCVKNKNEPLEKILLGLKRNLKDKQLLEFADVWQNFSSKVFSIPNLLRYLSFDGAQIKLLRKQANGQWEFHAIFDCAPCDVPIAMFNSRLRTAGLDVVYVPYPLTVEALTERLRAVERRQCGMICLMNTALSLGDRRKLAQAMKIRAELKNILVIDRVPAVYLTAFEQSERRERLLKALLPFANVNPFDEPSPELFIGRERELEALRDINGATFLIGGRQLGKTALLERLIALENKPKEGSYVIQSDGADIERLRAELLERLSSDEVRKVIAVLDVNQMFAVLDDNLKPLERLREEYSGRFKFIVTAYHDLEVNEAAVRLRPLTEEEATRLTAAPLNYLGLRANDVGVMRSIWIRSNYNPSMMKFYCGRIVEAIADGYAPKKFDATGNPPYDFDDEFLKQMKDIGAALDGMTERVLHEGRDDYYYVLMLALALAPFYYGEPRTDLPRLQEICLISDINDLATMSAERMERLLEEMIGLKMFRRAGDAYEFYRREHRRLFGNDEKALEKRLMECKERRLNE